MPLPKSSLKISPGIAQAINKSFITIIMNIVAKNLHEAAKYSFKVLLITFNLSSLLFFDAAEDDVWYTGSQGH